MIWETQNGAKSVWVDWGQGKKQTCIRIWSRHILLTRIKGCHNICNCKSRGFWYSSTPWNELKKNDEYNIDMRINSYAAIDLFILSVPVWYTSRLQRPDFVAFYSLTLPWTLNWLKPNGSASKLQKMTHCLTRND